MAADRAISRTPFTFSDIIGTSQIFAEAIDAGKMDLGHFVTQRYPIEQFAEAMHMADKRPEPVLKVMMTF